jgi:hypothetical protein
MRGCTHADCPVHHPRKRPQQIADDTKWKAEQEKQRREAAISNTTGTVVAEQSVAFCVVEPLHDSFVM